MLPGDLVTIGHDGDSWSIWSAPAGMPYSGGGHVVGYLRKRIHTIVITIVDDYLLVVCSEGIGYVNPGSLRGHVTRMM